MDAAFLILVAKRPGIDLADRVPAGHAASDLGFETAHRIDRPLRGGAVHVAAWHAGPTAGGGAWMDGPSAITVVAGHLRWRGQAWGAPSSWAGPLAAVAEGQGVNRLRDELSGVFAAGHVNETGDGWLVTDPLGLRCVYRGEDADVVAVGTRSALVARALAPGSTPPRDADPFGWMAFVGHHLGDRTGYAGVCVVPPGDRLRLRSGVATWERTDPLVVDPGDDLRSCSIAELAEIVQDDVADALTAALSRPAEKHVMLLTGGKDSRLLLAAAVRAGLADAFTYRTMGPPDLADVRIAEDLCGTFGLRHETRFLAGMHSEPFAERFQTFVARTGGVVSGWDMNTPARSEELHLTGLGGEPLRSYVRVNLRRLERDGLASAVPKQSFGHLGLIGTALAEDLHGRLLRLLHAEPHPSAAPLDHIHALYAGGRMRFTRFGPREELPGANRFHPLYSRTTLQAAMAMDPVDRTEELLFAELMLHADRRLVELPFAKGGWSDRARAHIGRTHPDIALRPPTPLQPGLQTIPVMASIQGAGSQGRLELLGACLSDETNPAWDILNRTAAVDALGRFPDLTRRERSELFGAATAVVWLAR